MRRLLLIGGGHSHVEVVRRLRGAPLPRTEAALVSRERHLVYTGMLPGLVAGHYPYDACRIDLVSLCRSAGVRFLEAEVVEADVGRRTIRCHDGREAGFDLLSLDVGSLPDASGVPGASAHALPVKPVSRLLTGWQATLDAARRAPQSVLVVGGGAGGVELTLAMEHRLRLEGIHGTRLALATDGGTLLGAHPPAAGRWFARTLAERGIALHFGRAVRELQAGAARLADGTRIEATRVVWATAAAAPPWLAQSGLACDARGFVSVDDNLRSVSHDFVFASGDCASLARQPLPKSGVYAVREGPALAENLRRAVMGAPLGRYVPQRHALALISTGGRHAVATWDGIALRGAWAWRWKDWIDRRFVAAYRAPD